jgi:hypothetical protein
MRRCSPGLVATLEREEEGFTFDFIIFFVLWFLEDEPLSF